MFSVDPGKTRCGRSLFAFLFLTLLVVTVDPAWCLATKFIPRNASWKYLDDGSNQGTGWRSLTYNDSLWRAGNAQLGYGDGDETTVIRYGVSATNKHITTYFRKKFSVTNRSLYNSLVLRLVRDDGAVVYLNGKEIFRTNISAGTVSYTTRAITDIGHPAENKFIERRLVANALINGTNIIAVEIHQSSTSSTDLSFDLELVGSDIPVVLRGPYLQKMTPSSVTVHWRTNVAVTSRVLYGTDPANLNLTKSVGVSTTNHAVQLTGLRARTRYYYAIASGIQILKRNTGQFFWTAPAAGTSVSTRVWVLGDSGTANVNARAVRQVYYWYAGSAYTDMILMLGDNAYVNGTDPEYQRAVFNTYSKKLPQTVLWSTIGNHDTAQTTNPPSTIPYYSIFNFPKRAEAGGVASGTEDYYSFDYGNIHFVCIDSQTSELSPSGPMLTWLKSDLANNTKLWTVAFWHHPPYSKGSHDSDQEARLTRIRENILPVLENYGVDLVLSGHSHSYERSFLIDGHYGFSNTFNSGHKVDGGSGRADGSGAYQKTSGGHKGAVYVVAGSSGKTSSGALNHPAMFISLLRLGSVVIEVNGNRMDVKFLQSNYSTGDYFRIEKGSGGSTNQLPAVSLTSPQSGQTFSAPANITVSASASDPDGSVSKVEFFANSSLIGTDTSSPFSLAWNNVNAGSYNLAARATDNEGGSRTSSTVGITVQGDVPAAPSNLSGVADSHERIDLEWNDNSENETGFRMERSVNGSSFEEIGVFGANVTSFTDSQVAHNKTYQYRVRAYNVNGTSPYSNTATVQTPHK